MSKTETDPNVSYNVLAGGCGTVAEMPFLTRVFITTLPALSSSSAFSPAAGSRAPERQQVAAPALAVTCVGDLDRIPGSALTWPSPGYGKYVGSGRADGRSLFVLPLQLFAF